MRRSVVIFLALVSFITLSASPIDSLYKVLDNYYNSSPHKALEVIEKIYGQIYRTSPQQAIELVGRAIYMCDSVLKNQELAAKWKARLAQLYLEQGQLDQATSYYMELRDYYKNRDKCSYGKAIMHLGDIFFKLSVPEIALDYYQNAINVFDNINDYDDKAITESKIAMVYYNNYKVDTAYYILNSILKCNKISLETKAHVQKNLAELYFMDEVWDSAMIYYNNALEYYRTAKDNLSVADLLIKISTIYMTQGNYKNAISSINQAKVIYQKYNLYKGLGAVYNELGNLYLSDKQEDKAVGYFLKAVENGQLAQSTDILKTAYKQLSQIYENKKQLLKALYYHKLYTHQLNKYYKNLIGQGYAEVILTFQNEEKQKEIQILKNEEKLRTQQLKFVLAALAVLLVFVLIIVFIMRRLQKTKKLLEKQYQQIKLQKRELETQSRILEKATQSLLKQKDKIEKQNRDIESSIRYASRIQKAMLPSDRLFEKLFDGYFILYQPKETVSGDFYWLAEILGDKPSLFRDEQKRKVVLAVGDCTGHGVPGAFMSMLGDAYLNQIIKIQHIAQPDKILFELNKYIRETLQQSDTESMDGMDIGICVIDFQERTLEFSGAKQDLIYVQNNKMVRVHGDTFSIGGLKQEKNKIFTLKKVDLTDEIIFYMYTDGYQDQFGGQYGRKYMARNFRTFLFSIWQLPMEEQKKALIQEYKKWKGKKYPQMDDITVIGIKIKGKFDSTE